MSITEREHVTEMPSILDPRVERGAALLDEKMPGWANRVDVDTLRLWDPCLCILGQSFPGPMGWTRGLRALGIGMWESCDHGFCDKVGGTKHDQDWRLAILSRQQS